MNTRKWNLQRFGTYLFYIAIILETLFVLLDKSNYIIQHETWSFRFTFLLFAGKIALTRYSRREYCAMTAMILIGIISWYMTDREELIRIVALIIACKDMDIKTVCKVVFYVTFAGCLVIMGLSLTGIYGDAFITALYRGGGIEETRYCFGMGHPNAFHCMFMAIVVLGLYVYNDAVKWWGYLILGILNIGLFLLTDSNTGVVITSFTIALAPLIKLAKRREKLNWIFAGSVLLLFVSIGFTVLAGTGGEGEYPWILPINRLLNGRLQLSFVQGGVATWSLFSQPGTEYYFDMGWMRLFYWYGIIPAVGFIVLTMLTIWQCYKHRDGNGLLLLDVFIAYTVLEAHAISVYIGRNYMLFIIGMYWTSILYGNKKKEITDNGEGV